MDNKVLGKALSIIGGIISAIWGVRYFYLLLGYHQASRDYYFKNSYDFTMRGQLYYNPNYGIAPEIMNKMRANSLTIFLIGLAILAFGLLLIYLTNQKEAPKEEAKEE